MSRAASKPLPPPPPNSVWARVEEAREEEGLTYGRFSRLAGKKIGHYRTIATRGKWVSQDATRDQFVRALVKLGWSREWLVLGVGERRTDGKSSSEERHAASVEELNLMRWRAIRELVDVDGIDLARAGQLVGRVRIFRRPDVSWGDYYSAARHIAREEDKAERAKRSEKPAV